MFLTHEEVCELTGARIKKNQILNLVQNGVRHTIKENGWPSVARHSVLNAQENYQQKESLSWQPAKNK